jgi:hypothetical protein
MHALIIFATTQSMLGYMIGYSMHVLYDVSCGMRDSMVCWMDDNLCDRGRCVMRSV